MRVLCVGRHAYLSEHLCRYFSELGAECEPATGLDESCRAASRFEPHVVVSESDLLTASMLDSWLQEPALADVPVLAVSLTRRPEESGPPSSVDVAGTIYLPALDRGQARALLEAAYRPRGVQLPANLPVSGSETRASAGLA